LNLIEEKETLRQELKYIRAGPATQNLADNVRAKLIEIYAKTAEIRTTVKQIRIKSMLDSMFEIPDSGISQNPRTFGPANTGTWQLIKKIHGIQEPTPQLPNNIYTNMGPSPHSAWTRGPLASNPKEAGKAWNEFRRALGSNHRDPLNSHINEYLAFQVDRDEIQRDSSGFYRQHTHPDPPLPTYPSTDQSRWKKCGKQLKNLRTGKAQDQIL